LKTLCIPRVAEKMLELFANRVDTYAVDEGMGVRRVEKPLTAEAVLDHLRGRYELVLYAINPERSTSKWTCWDLERGVALLRGRLIKVFPEKSVLVEATSGRGYHLWLLYRTPIPSELARAIGLHFAKGLEVEVFPKQPWVKPDGYGAGVRLPLGYRKATDRWSRLLWPRSILDVEPCLPGLYLDLRRFSQPVPWWLTAQRCVFRIRDQRGGWSCTRLDGSIGICSPEYCPAAPARLASPARAGKRRRDSLP